ncbi:MAG: hypothetical protein OXD43_04790 [Bacteroidetes bacterium]|nr:hypothetical protein [Bacteroidota bacterium]
MGNNSRVHARKLHSSHGTERKVLIVAGRTDSITLEEVLRLGDESAGDTILFGSISQIAVNGRGDIIVAESDPKLIHTFGSEVPTWSLVGGQGQGQGEYLFFRAQSSGMRIPCICGNW